MKRSLLVWIKLLVALIAIGFFVALAARDMFPSTPLLVVLVYAIGGAILMGVVVVGVMWLKFVMNQAFLKSGAIDTQWLWFNNDPRGLSEIRSRVPPHVQTSDNGVKVIS